LSEFREAWSEATLSETTRSELESSEEESDLSEDSELDVIGPRRSSLSELPARSADADKSTDS
jgi:hypothetical protein